MNVLALNFEKLPTPLRLLGEQERMAFEDGISPFLSPLNHLAALVKRFSGDLRDEDKGFYLQLMSTLLGLERLKLPYTIGLRFLPVLAEYIAERGTKRGLEIMTQCILGTQDFIIQERTYPYPVMFLDQSFHGQRLTEEDHEAISLTVVFGRERNSFLETDLQAYRDALSQELPPEMEVYLIFKTNHKIPVPPQYCAIVGERLL